MSIKLAVPGAFVQKAAQTIPTTATANIYTVANGLVLVTGLFGVVSTTLASTANLSVGTTAGGTATVMTATALNNNAAGTMIVPVNSSGKGGAGIIAGAAFVQNPPFFINPVIVAAGNITWTTNAAATGAVTWYLWYMPIDAGASVSQGEGMASVMPNKSLAVADNGLVLDSAQSTDAQASGAVYDSNTKKWKLNGMNYKQGDMPKLMTEGRCILETSLLEANGIDPATYTGNPADFNTVSLVTLE